MRTNEGDFYAKNIIISTGASHRKLGVPGEKELAGMGVSYCATCDGAFFRGRTVAVVGGGDVAVGDALFLARGCEKVYLQAGLLWNRSNKNADFPGALLSAPGSASDFCRDPHDHDPHICNAGYVIRSYDGKRIRHRRRLRHGRNPGDDSLLHCDTSVGILDFAIYLKRKSLTILTKSNKSPASIGKSNKQWVGI